MIVHSFLSDKVTIISSAVDRRGAFAKKPIKKGEVICVYGGHIITQDEYDALQKKRFKNISDYAIRVADGFYLVSSKDGKLEDDDFFNHSCDPNLGICGHLLMVAMRDIKQGEELTYDYCMTDADFDYSFACNCGVANCRRVITADDWKRPALQKKYKGFFSWYVQDKINRLRHHTKNR